MEATMLIIGIIFGVIIGIAIGIFIGMERMRKAVENQSVGRLRIDRSEPDEPARLFIELYGVTPDMLAQHTHAILEVINESYISHD